MAYKSFMMDSSDAISQKVEEIVNESEKHLDRMSETQESIH